MRMSRCQAKSRSPPSSATWTVCSRVTTIWCPKQSLKHNHQEASLPRKSKSWSGEASQSHLNDASLDSATRQRAITSSRSTRFPHSTRLHCALQQDNWKRHRYAVDLFPLSLGNQYGIFCRAIPRRSYERMHVTNEELYGVLSEHWREFEDSIYRKQIRVNNQ